MGGWGGGGLLTCDGGAIRQDCCGRVEASKLGPLDLGHHGAVGVQVPHGHACSQPQLDQTRAQSPNIPHLKQD